MNMKYDTIQKIIWHFHLLKTLPAAASFVWMEIGLENAYFKRLEMDILLISLFYSFYFTFLSETEFG